MKKKYLSALYLLNQWPVLDQTGADASLARLGKSVTTQSGSRRQYVGSGRQYVTGS